MQIFEVSRRMRIAVAILWLGVGAAVIPASAPAQATKKPPVKAPAPTKAPATYPGQKKMAPMKPPPPGGKEVKNKNGIVTKTKDGKPAEFTGNDGARAKFDKGGKPVEVQKGNTTVSRGPGGQRRTEIYHPEEHSRVVSYGHGRGFVEHRYEYGGHTYYDRSYYYHGGYYRGYYRGYNYHGAYLWEYRPAYYYPPVYYNWAYNPWPAPVPYTWSWGAAPWYGYYGAYFAPYPVYPSAAYWLVDYMVAASLAQAYAAAAAASGGDSAHLHRIDPAHLIFASYDPASGVTSPIMTKEIKDAVADEMKLELDAAEKNPDATTRNSNSLEALLADGKPHVFVANAGLSVDSGGTNCGITEGDVLALSAPPKEDSTTATLRTLASKQTDCAKGSTVSVELTDLQEMHNNLLASIDRGMADMKDHPGQGGLPAPPADAISGTKAAPYAADAPADANGEAVLDQAAAEGAQTEQEVAAEANASDESGGPAAQGQSGGSPEPTPPQPAHTKTIGVGDTIAQVVAIKGQPKSIMNIPPKTIYVYPDVKITFINGKLTDVD